MGRFFCRRTPDSGGELHPVASPLFCCRSGSTVWARRPFHGSRATLGRTKFFLVVSSLRRFGWSVKNLFNPSPLMTPVSKISEEEWAEIENTAW